MGLIDSFRILKTLIVPNQNEKVLEETLAGSNSNVNERAMRHLSYFKMILLLFQVIQKSLLIPPVTLSYAIESITNGYVG